MNWLYIHINESNLNLSLSLEDFVIIITTFSQPALLLFSALKEILSRSKKKSDFFLFKDLTEFLSFLKMGLY